MSVVSFSHRHGDHLPVVGRHLQGVIRAGEEGHTQRGQRGEPTPQQLSHDPHLRSHEWYGPPQRPQPSFKLDRFRPFSSLSCSQSLLLLCSCLCVVYLGEKTTGQRGA